MIDRRTANARALVVCAVLAALIFWIYLPVARFEFLEIFDDHYYLKDNVHVPKGITAEGVKWAFTSVYKPYWQPLAVMSHMLDVELFGMNSGAHHLVNVLVHFVNSLLLFFVLKAMTGAFWRSAAVAAIFSVHPLHVESVAWIAERKDVLSATFWIASLGAYLRYARTPGTSTYALTIFLFALGLMVKPMLVTLPFILLVVDCWPLKRFGWRGSEGQGGEVAVSRASGRKIVAEKVPFLVLALGVGVTTFLVQRQIGALSSLDAIPLESRLSNAVMSYAAYVFKIVWPFDLAVIYPYRAGEISPAAVAAILAALAGVTVFAVRIPKRPYLLTGWLWYLVSLLPVIGLVQSGAQAMADRFVYLPAVGLYIILSWGAVDIIRWQKRLKRPIALAAVAVLALLAIRARDQVAHWHDSVSLFTHALAVTDENVEAHKNLGKALYFRGDHERAASHYREALRIRPKYAEVHNDLGTVLYSLGRKGEAAGHFRSALAIRPGYVEALNNLAVISAETGNNREAVMLYRRALETVPERDAIHNNLGVALMRLGRGEEALQSFLRALEINPDNVEARANLDLLTGTTGKP